MTKRCYKNILFNERLIYKLNCIKSGHNNITLRQQFENDVRVRRNKNGYTHDMGIKNGYRWTYNRKGIV